MLTRIYGRSDTAQAWAHNASLWPHGHSRGLDTTVATGYTEIRTQRYRYNMWPHGRSRGLDTTVATGYTETHTQLHRYDTIKPVNKGHPLKQNFLALTARLLLFRGHFISKSVIREFVNWPMFTGWPLFGGGLASRFDCICWNNWQLSIDKNKCTA